MSDPIVDNKQSNPILNLQNVSTVNTNSSIQLIFASLQLELAKSNKEAAFNKISDIKKSQDLSRRFTSLINELRSCKGQVKEMYDIRKIFKNHYIEKEGYSFNLSEDECRKYSKYLAHMETLFIFGVPDIKKRTELEEKYFAMSQNPDTQLEFAKKVATTQYLMESKGKYGKFSN